MVYTGLVPGRDADQLGVALAVAHSGEAFKRAQARAGTPAEEHELALELTYRASLTPWLTVQPDVQLVLNPGADAAMDNAVVVGCRCELSF